MKQRKYGGIETEMYQDEWQDIYFKDLNVELSRTRLATQEFYSAFYKALFATYNSYQSLPCKWRKEKRATADQISRELSIDGSVLSFGCGIGFIEKILTDTRPDLSITSFDFSEMASKWINEEVMSINCVTEIDETDKFDAIYLCQVLYAMPYDECIKIINYLSKHLTENGIMILINTSATPLENNHLTLRPSVLSKLKGLLRSLYQLVIPDSAKGIQFWGWARDNKAYISIARAANLNVRNVYSAANQSFIVLGS